jgi:flagellar hook-basal body complex protein FliE
LIAMNFPISPIRPVSVPEITQLEPRGAQPGGFQSVLEGVIGKVEQSQTQASQAVNNFVTGGNEELHSVALATQRAELEFDMFLQVRNKVVSAYQEVMRMQV